MHQLIARVICFNYTVLFYLTTLSVCLTVCVCMCMWIYGVGMMSTIKDERTPVWIAALKGHVDVVKFLVLEANADPNKPHKVWIRARVSLRVM